MQRMYPQIEPPKKSFMDQAGWQLIIIIASLLAGIIGTIIVGIWQGTTHVIDFNWLVLIFIGIMLGIMVFCVWYTSRTRQKLQEQYVKDIDMARSDFLKYKTETMNLRTQETEQWNNWAISFTQANAREQKERLEEMEKRCMEAIQGVEQRFDVAIKNAQTIFSGAVESERLAVELYGKQLIHALEQMQALEGRLKKELQPDTIDQSSEVETPSA